MKGAWKKTNKTTGCNSQYKWCKAEATNYEFGKHIFMPASDRIISKVSIWILDYPFSQHPRFESRVVTKQRRDCCKMLLTLECFGRILISNKSLLSSRIYRQATEFWIVATMLIIRIRTENWTEKTFLEGRHAFALLLSGTWLLLPVKPLCWCWKADVVTRWMVHLKYRGRENLASPFKHASFGSSPDGFKR